MHLEALIAIGTLTIVLGAPLYLLHVFLMRRWRQQKPDDPRSKTIASMHLVVTAIVTAGVAVGGTRRSLGLQRKPLIED